MTETIVAVYDTHEHAEEAIAALLQFGVPESSLHRHIRDGDDLTGERPVIVDVEPTGFLAALFSDDQPAEHTIPSDSPEAGGTVIRVTAIPPGRYEPVLEIVQRFHPSEIQGRPMV